MRRLRNAALVLVLLVGSGACRKPRPTVDPGPASPVTCGGAAVDLRTDAKHCGFCGHACEAGHGATSCVDGACRPVCEPGFVACVPAEGCVHRVAKDARACGKCGVSCENAFCINGTCGPAATVAKPELESWYYGVTFVLDGYAYGTRTSSRLALATLAEEELPPSFRPVGYESSTLLARKGEGAACEVVRRDSKGTDATIAKWPDCPHEFVAAGGRAYFARLTEKKTRPGLQLDFHAIVARDLATGAEVTLASDQGGASVVWAHGGRVYWESRTLADPSAMLRSCPTTGGAAATELVEAAIHTFSTDGKSFFVNAQSAIARLPFGGGDPEWLLAAPAPRKFMGVIVAGRDLYTVIQSGRSDALYRTQLPEGP